MVKNGGEVNNELLTNKLGELNRRNIFKYRQIEERVNKINYRS